MKRIDEKKKKKKDRCLSTTLTEYFVHVGMTTCYLLRTYASYPLEVDLVPRLFSDEMIIGPAQSLSPVLQAQNKPSDLT